MAGEVVELRCTSLPAGPGFFDDLAVAMLAACASEVESGDLSAVCILVPALPMAAELRAAIVRAIGRPLLLPRFDTLKSWVHSQAAAFVPDAFPDSQRRVLLHEVLRERGWFDEAALWGIADEMAGLFDELSGAALDLPEDETALAEQLQRTYAVRASSPLAFEARVVYELWHALTASGQVDAAAVYRFRLAELLRQSEGNAESAPRLLVLLDAAPEESLDSAERVFLGRYGDLKPVRVYYPLPRRSRSSPLLAVLDTAWLDGNTRETTAPLFERAAKLALQLPESPLLGQLQLVPASGREAEARAVVSQVGEWLTAGLRRIALIAQDRLTARRVRALLEREGVLISDETGWKLSTSRAAAAVDALLETVAGNAYFRDLLDLCKSPHVFADIAEDERKAAVFILESALRKASVKSGLLRVRRCLQTIGSDPATERALLLLDRIEAACALLDARPASLVRWIGRLQKALEVLGAIDALRGDAAGQVLLDLLEMRRGELDGSLVQFSFNAWRDWLNREFESANFRDAAINSPIVLTPLNAVCLRRFEAAVLIGCDARQLSPENGGAFFNQSVRRELGLRTREDDERALRRDLELLLATVPHVVVTWQSERDGEANLLAPELALLSTLHRLAWQDDLCRPPLPVRSENGADVETTPQTTLSAAPVAPLSLIPGRVSVSAYANLVACPYRFFARYVLGLVEMDEVQEEMDKSEYGLLVHRVLERFHRQCPVVFRLSEAQALAALQACVDDIFAPAVEDNFLAIGWKQRWEKRLSAYLDWQREVEAEGWRWAQAETPVSHYVSLAGDAGGGFGAHEASGVELYGRIDRIDIRSSDACAVSYALIDYKTQSVKAVRERLSDDIQLASYALLHGGAEKASYLALDDERIVAVSSDEGSQLVDAAKAQGRRLGAVFGAMRQGAKLPAHGTESVCAWCEMRGLCRKDFAVES